MKAPQCQGIRCPEYNPDRHFLYQAKGHISFSGLVTACFAPVPRFYCYILLSFAPYSQAAHLLTEKWKLTTFWTSQVTPSQLATCRHLTVPCLCNLQGAVSKVSRVLQAVWQEYKFIANCKPAVLLVLLIRRMFNVEPIWFCDLTGMSVGYAERLTFREDLGGRLGDPEIYDAQIDIVEKAKKLATLVGELWPPHSHQPEWGK